jgi:hypothetical protein
MTIKDYFKMTGQQLADACEDFAEAIEGCEMRDRILSAELTVLPNAVNFLDEHGVSYEFASGSLAAECYRAAWQWNEDEEMPEPAYIETPASTETAESMLDWHESLTLDSDRETGLTLWADALRDALERDPRASRLEVSAARGQRIMHHAWNGAAWSERWSGCATMDTLTESEAAAVEDAIAAADAALAEFAAKVSKQEAEWAAEGNAE